MDMNCNICSEPWDSYGVRHGDLLKWEKDLFLRGAGCPCCLGEGESYLGLSKEEAYFVFLLGLDHGGFHKQHETFLYDLEVGLEMVPTSIPKWIEPPPTVLHTCDLCKVNVSEDPSGDIIWHSGDKVHYTGGNYGVSYGVLYGHEEAEDYKDGLIDFDGVPYCPGCVQDCCECGGTLYRCVEHLDGVYSRGYPMEHPDHPFYRPVCMDCYDDIRDTNDIEYISHLVESSFEFKKDLPEDHIDILINLLDSDDSEDGLRELLISRGWLACESCYDDTAKVSLNEAEDEHWCAECMSKTE